MAGNVLREISARAPLILLKEKEGGPTDRSLGSFRLCIRHDQGRGRSILAVQGMLPERLEERTRILAEFHNSGSLHTLLGRLDTLLGIGGRENKPSTGTYHSSYTCLTASGNWKPGIKRIRKLTEACKPRCRTLHGHGSPFAPNTARIR
jgi:hypothetical protein